MKIVVQAANNNHLHGFKSLCEMRNHKWIWWEEQHTSAFDVFDEIQPDLFIGYGTPSRGIQRCLKCYPKTHTLFQLGPYTYHVGNQILSFPTLINSDVHHPSSVNPKLLCDIACCEQPHPHLLALCYPIGKFSIKISGKEVWPTVQYMGYAHWTQLVQLYQSTRIVYANTPEEAGRGIACGALCITSNKQLFDTFQGTITHADSATELNDKCQQILKQKNSNNYSAQEFIKDLTYTNAFDTILQLLSDTGLQL